MNILETAIYRFNGKAIDTSHSILHNNRKKNPKIHMESEKILERQRNSEQKEGYLRDCHFRLKDLLHNSSSRNNMVLAQNRHIDEWNKIKYPDMSIYNYCHLIFDKVVKNIQWKKENIFNK